MIEAHEAKDARTDPPAKRAYEWTIELRIAAGMLLFLGVLTFANVVVRYTTNFSFAFTEELTVLFLSIAVLLGASHATARGSHIRVMLILEHAPQHARSWLEQAADAGVAATFLVMALYGARVTLDEFRYGDLTPGLGNPQWSYSIWLPLISIFVAGRAVWRMIRRATRANVSE